MSADKKRMVTEFRSGQYPEWIFGDADHLPTDAEGTVDFGNEYIIHTEYPRFIATIEANRHAYNVTKGIPVGTPLVKQVHDFGLDTVIVVGWEVNGKVAEVAYSRFVNLDGTAFETNKVAEYLGEATQMFAQRCAEDNRINGEGH